MSDIDKLIREVKGRFDQPLLNADLLESLEKIKKAGCQHHCICYFERGECCNCGANKAREEDEWDLVDTTIEDRKLEQEGG